MAVDNSHIIDAIEVLKSLRVIDRNVEIARALGFSEPTVSNYLSNRVKVSKDFKKEIEQNKNAESVYVKQLLGKGINGLNGTLNDLKRIAGIQEERLSEHFNEDRLMAMSSIVQYLTNCSTEQLELIESQFENTKKQNQ